MKRNTIEDYYKIEVIEPEGHAEKFGEALKTNDSLIIFGVIYECLWRATCKICDHKINIQFGCCGGEEEEDRIRESQMKDHLWLHINEKKLESK